MPESETNYYSNRTHGSFIAGERLLQFRSRHAYRHLSQLDSASATGPDNLSTIFLKNIAGVISFAFAQLARRIITTGIWPSLWKRHWIVPLFKKGSRHLASNYRGLQITSQLSKAMERFIGAHFLDLLSFSGSFGLSQFAYRKYHGSRDALLFIVFDSDSGKTTCKTIRRLPIEVVWFPWRC